MLYPATIVVHRYRLPEVTSRTHWPWMLSYSSRHCWRLYILLQDGYATEGAFLPCYAQLRNLCSAIIRIKPRPLVLCCWSAVSPPFSFLLSTQLKGSHPVMADEVPGLKRDSTMAVTAQVICDNDLVS